MQLTLWTYEGPPHVGAMRIATAMQDVHYVLHAPQGDTYADLLFTMIERRHRRPPVTYTTFQARDLGGDTADLFKRACRDAAERFRPAAMLVGASCTAELIQDDPGGLAMGSGLSMPVVPLELPAYQKKENWGASETLYQLVRTLCTGLPVPERAPVAGRRPVVNLLGATALGFRHRDDVTEVTRLLDLIGVDVAIVMPLDATVADVRQLPAADLNVVLYPEIAASTAGWLKRTFRQPHTTVVPIGIGATRDFVREVATLTGLDVEAAVATISSRLPWYSRSVDSTYLTGKRVFIFGDGTHALAAARIATEELAFEVVGLGTYSREMGLEEHLLGMFREDFEFADGASPSHLGHGHAAPPVTEDRAPATATTPTSEVVATLDAPPSELVWGPDAEAELKKIPFFVRGKARRNTERYAAEHGIALISLETLYEAKAHFSR